MSKFLTNINLTNNKAINVATPTATTDAANKAYVDTGLATKPSLYQGGLAQTPIIMSPESSQASAIPYFTNDISYNRHRGGVTRVYYDGVLQTGTDSNTDKLFTPTSDAASFSVVPAQIIIEIDLCRSFSWGSKIGYAVNENWRAKDVKLEWYKSGPNVWVTAADVTNVAYGEKLWNANCGSGESMTKLRFTFSNWNTSGFRIGNIFVLNYASPLGEGPFVSRGGGEVYGNIDLKNNRILNSGTPTGANDAANKAYVDGRKLSDLASPTSSVDMNSQALVGLPGLPGQTIPADPALWQYVIPGWFALSNEAAITKGFYKWASQFNITTNAPPTNNGAILVGSSGSNGASWQNEVKVEGASGAKKITGLTGTPTNSDDAATKAYVDSSFTNGVTSVAQEEWHTVGSAGEPAVSAGFANYSAPYQPQFRKDPAGRVELAGLIANTTTTTHTTNILLFTLPVGYRPHKNRLFNVRTLPGGASNGTGRLEIQSSGAVYFSEGAILPAASGGWVALDGVDFHTGQTTFPAGKSIIPVVSALPIGPTDGDEVYYQNAAMETQGVLWHLRYRANSASTKKWEYIGGSELVAEPANSVSASSITAWTDVTGTTLTLPLSGDYDLTYSAFIDHSGTNQGVYVQPVATGLSTGTSAAYLFLGQPTTNSGATVSVSADYRASNISGNIRLQYYVGASGGTISAPKLRIKPVRVG